MPLSLITPLLNARLTDRSGYPHGTNLHTKAIGQLNTAKINALRLAIPAYLSWRDTASAYEAGTVTLSTLLAAADVYYDLIKTTNVNRFSRQSDFVSSLLPEVICSLLRKVVHGLPPPNGGLIVTAQKSLTVDCTFDISAGGRLVEKRKRMDIAVLAPGHISFNGCGIDFPIPAVCMEVKTNIDKNMLSGIEASVDTLKRTFPQCRYYAVGEFSDFEIQTQNYASTGIDEILIVRKQRRSEVRRSPSSRNALSIDLIEGFMEEIDKHLRDTVIRKPALAVRMQDGRLT